MLPAAAVTISLPQTGQTSCWDAAGSAVSCAGTGQDGALISGAPWSVPRFVDNGDQTVTDQVTSLSWSKNANPAGAPLSWQQTLDYVKTLNSQNYRGHNDWRLPDVNELASLVNAQQGDLPAWLTAQGFAGVQAANYWSSDNDAYANGNAWYLGLESGYLYSDEKSWSNYLWPVRGGGSSPLSVTQTGQTSCFDAGGNAIACTGSGQDGETQEGAPSPVPRFTDNGDQTMTDNLTGLIWSKDADVMKSRDPGFDTDYVAANSWESVNDGAVSWQHALDYVARLNSQNFLGHNDWRLPNRIELASLIDWQYAYPAVWLTVTGFLNVPADYFWSSTSDPLYTNAAWFVDMGSGYQDSYYKTDNHYVWPVRGGAQPQSIGFTPPAGVHYGDPAVTLAATASSGLPVNYGVVSGPATVSGNQLTVTGVGTVTVKASQAGNLSFATAADSTASFTVAPKALTITANNASRAYGAANPANPGFTAPALVGTDSISSLTFSYPAAASATATVGTSYSITPSAAVFGSGSAANYAVGYVAGTLTIAGIASQSISFAPPAAATYGDAALTPSATASSGLPVSFALVSGPASLNGSTLTITGAGTISLRASQGGNVDYAAAADVTGSIAVAPKALTVTAANASRAYGAANPANPGFSAAGLIGGDSIVSVSYGYAAAATATAAVGSTHSITPSTAVFSAGSATNYLIRYLPGTLTVTVPADAVQPALAVSTLTSGALTNNPVLNVTGTAGDAYGIKGLTVNGSAVAVAADGSFSRAAP